MTTQRPWRVTSNIIDGKMMYGVFRPLGNPGEPDHSGNREVFDYFESREAAQDVADNLNRALVHDDLPTETQLSIDSIDLNPLNPRKRFDEIKLQELAKSIDEVGILQPLVVTESDTPGKYLLIAGERRLRAAKMIGLEHVPVVFRRLPRNTPADQAACMLIENLQREDLDPIEEANAYATLTRDYGWKQTELAETLGISQSHIANRMRLLQLPEKAREAISAGKLTASAGKELATYAKVPKVRKAIEEAVEDGDDARDILWQARNAAHDATRPLHHKAYPDPEFDLKPCERCKDRVFLPERWGEGDQRLPRCTNPKCWEEKQETAKKEAAERAKQQVLDIGHEVVEINGLPYGSYQYLGNAKFDTAECENCEHNKMGYYKSEHYHNEPEPLCLNMDCFNAKTRAAEKEARRIEKELREAFEERKEDMVAVFKPTVFVPTESADFKALVYIAAQVIHHPPWSSRMTKAKVEDAVYERYGWKKPEGLSWSEEEKHLVQQLAALTAEELLRLMLFVMLKPVEHDNRTFNAVFGEEAASE